MSRSFILSCESTVDVPYSHLEERDIHVIFYHYVIDDVDYVDDMERDPEARPEFYRLLDQGKLPQTSQINVFTYKEYLEELVKQGDVLHITFTSGQSGSWQNAFAAADELRAEYPDRKIMTIDSVCSSTGYGMLMDFAADMADAGASIEEVYEWVENNKKRLHHQFFSSNMTQFKRTGRVSGPTAAIATVLNICPIMRLDDKGRIIAYSKVRGKKKAVAETVRMMLEYADDGADYDQKCWINNANCMEDAEELRTAVEEAFPKLKGKIPIYNIGTIIGSHCGYGTVAVFFLGTERAPE